MNFGHTQKQHDREGHAMLDKTWEITFEFEAPNEETAEDIYERMVAVLSYGEEEVKFIGFLSNKT